MILTLTTPFVSVDVDLATDAPVTLIGITPTGGTSLVEPLPLVDVFTSIERKTRMSRSHVFSTIGRRLRYSRHTLGDSSLEITQYDERTGLSVTTHISVLAGTAAARFETSMRNDGPTRVSLIAVTSAVLGLGSGPSLDRLDVAWGESEWIAEGRWHESPLLELAAPVAQGRRQPEGRVHFSATSHGAWSTGEVLPVGVIADRDSGDAIAWQVETSAPWKWELGQLGDGAYLAIVGPTDVEHHFSTRLGPGESFIAVPVVVVASTGGRDGAFAALTAYRRALRGLHPFATALPIIYNDFMNTLMGDPTTEKLIPLIDAAAEAGAEYFCIDAGWHTPVDDPQGWSVIGEWREAPGRFANGLAAVTAHIRGRGMVPGLWIEPETIGARSPVATSLPEDAFFQRFGERVIDQDRHHLDFRHPAARAHLDATIDHLVETFGLGYIKLDYNINIGPGTDAHGQSAGEGLLGHTRAYRDWLIAVQLRHPGVLFENCAAGAMRMDYGLLSVTHIQSTSDQPDYLRYPPIAAAAPASILPEQSGNWVYPEVGLSVEQTAFTLVTGLAGRLYLTGFIDKLTDEQRGLVAEAVAESKRWRVAVSQSVPRWPLGLPAWNDDVIALQLNSPEGSLLAVWNRSTSAASVRIPGAYKNVTVLFPAFAVAESPTLADTRDGGFGLLFHLPPGPTARYYLLE